MSDSYSSYKQLMNSETYDANENGDYRISIGTCNRNKNVVIFTPHGGGIETYTSKIVKSIAGEDYSYYCFEGTKQDGNFDLHITSSNFDEPICQAMLERANIAIAIHGKCGDCNGILVGGKNQEIADRINDILSNSGFNANRCIRGGLSGTLSSNICNRYIEKGGVQLEIEYGLRNKLNRNDRELNRFSYEIRKAVNNFLYN